MSEGIRDYNRVGGGEGGKDGQHKSEKTELYGSTQILRESAVKH